MKKYLLLFAAVITIGSLNKVSAQFSYTFSTATTPAFTANATPTTIVAAATDESLSAATNIGFTFNYNCVNYTQFKASSNGWLTFNTAITSAGLTNDLDANTMGSCIAPLWDDNATGATGNVNYKLTGTAPNRILTIEWKQIEWNYGATTWGLSYQCKLYETTNVIDFIYTRNGGAAANLNSPSASIGISGATGQFYSLGDVTGAPAVSSVTETTNLSTKPATSQHYIFTPAPSCSGTPVNGTTTASAASVCSGSTVNLAVTGSSTGCGITYQWQSSPDNSVWSNIGGATAATYTPTITGSLYFRRVTSCSGTPNTGSASVQITVNPAYLCPCTSSATSTSDMDITNITFGTINNTSATVSLTGTQGTATGTAGMYSNWTASTVPVPSFQQGTSNAFSVTIGGTAFSHRVDVYIDFNQDGDFLDAGESTTIFPYANPALPNTTASTINIPIAASLGNTYMRVVCVESSSSSSCGTYTWGETEDYIINITAAAGCAGTPTAGTAVSSVAGVCSGSTADLSATGGTVASGLTYQWQSSTDNSSWSNIVGATSQTYTATVTVSTYYRLVVTCTASGLSSNSSSVLVSVSFLYCYCTSTATSTSDMDIGNVTFGTINNTSACGSLTGTQGVGTGTVSLYTDFTSTVPIPTVTQGTSVTASVTEDDCGNGTWSHQIHIYIDFNHDGDFGDAGEDFEIYPYTSSATHTASAAVAIPITALTGNTRMRVICVESSTISPCGTYSWGETEDYIINIALAPPCSGVPTPGTATSSIATFCNSGTPTLATTGYTTGVSGIGFQWYQSATTGPFAWGPISGATSATYVSPSISQTTYYYCEVACGASSANTNTLTVTNTASTITGTNNPVSVPCGSAASLTATASGGTINWYAASTGGTVLATGSPYAPTVSSNTTFYCTASSGGSTCNTGKPSWTAGDGYFGTSNWGIRFDALSAFTLVSVKVYVQTAGSTVGIQLQDNTGANIGAPVTTSATVAGVNTITLNLSIPVGTGYRLVSTNSTNLGRGSTGVAFPYTCAGVCSVTSSEWGGSTTGTYYFFYDWVVSTACESSPRTPVNVTVTGATAPVCSAYSSPTNGATGVCPVATTINWLASNTACRAATSYLLYFGTDAAATNIINGTDIGNVLTYNLGTLSATTTYYWKIVPTNSGGNATGCTVQSFVTAASPGSICPGLLGTGVVSVASLPYSSGAGTTAGSVNDLTSANTTTCGSTSYLTGEDQVFYFTPGSSGTITINLTSAGSYTGLMLYDGCPLSAATCGASPGACIANAQSSTGNKTLTACVVAGTTYYLVLDSWSTPSSNAYTNLTISAVTPFTAASNDLPCSATALTLAVTTNGNNACTGSTSEPSVPSCWTSGTVNTVWYTVVAPASGQISVRTLLGTLLNTQIAMYQGACGTLTQVSPTATSCNDNMTGCGSTEASQINVTGLTPGSTYYIVVDGSSDQTGSFQIVAIDPSTQSFPSTPGQDCSIAFPTCNSVLSVADPGYANTGSTCDFDGSDDCTSGERSSVWYTIDIQAAGNLTFDIIPNDYSGGAAGTETDYDFLVWKTGGAGATNCAGIATNSATGLVACNFSYLGVTGVAAGGNSPIDPSFDAAYETSIPVVAGEQYTIVIQNFTGSTSGFTIDYTSSTGGAIDYTPSPTIINWTGTSTTAWTTPSNWGGCAIPSCSISAVVGALVPRFPVISTNQSVNDLTIDAGATLTINAGVTLTVCGNFVNNGTLIMSPTATLLFNNTAAHTISGNLTGTNAIGNITVTQTAGSVTFMSDIDIKGNLTTSNSTSVINSNGKYVKLAGNFVNATGNTTYTNTGTTGTLEFNGTAAQSYNQGSSQLDLNYVVMNHTSTGVTLATNMFIKATTGSLTLTVGKITTNAFVVNVVNTTPACVSTGNATSYVNGNLRRYLAAGATGSFDFPVGNTANYERANLNFTSAAAAGAIQLLARFDAWGGAWTNPGAPGWGPECAATYNVTYLDNGYWSIDASAVSTGLYNLTLYNTGYGNAAAGWSIAKSPSGGPAWGLNGTCAASPVTAVVRNGMAGFSKFSTIQSSTPLPVQVLNFGGINKTTFNELKWESVSEEKLSYYELESSVDGFNFKKIYTVTASGESKTLNKYSFNDYYFYSPITFYRVKSIDKDGSSMYTKIIAIENKQKVQSVVKIFPNPATSEVNISMEIPFDTDLIIEIKDILGRTISSKTVKVEQGIQTINYGTSGLSEGTYIISTSIENLPNTNNQLIITK
ncbi:MAG: GEVED domain-containing protein [Bacteroidota bacterium]|nr:GEVED domain-containing protein [Bacteroidota bacterium]